ncbi:hypothetical protein D1P53_004211 [Cryptococcus gattii VGV]|nr:hypothetical protein D1P53_004211 [Cryptococcus gattii VGV]
MAGYLARYRAFVVPSPPQPEYGRLSPSHRPFQIDPQPLRLPPLPSPPVTLLPETIINPRKTKIPKKERWRTHERLLEHKWILGQEHERRFRRGMAAIMADVLKFQEANAIPAESGTEYTWKEGINLNCVMALQEFFGAIRKDSTAIYAYFDPLEISLVANRDEVHRMVKEEERKRRKREKKKANKELEKEAEARLNEERGRLESEREAEASLNCIEGLRRATDEVKSLPTLRPPLPPFLFPPKPALKSSTTRSPDLAHLPYLREEETVLLRRIEDQDARQAGKAAAAHTAAAAMETASELKWEDGEEVAAISVGDEAWSRPLSLSWDTLLDSAVTYHRISSSTSRPSHSRSSAPVFRIQPGSLNIDNDTVFLSTLLPSHPPRYPFPSLTFDISRYSNKHSLIWLQWNCSSFRRPQLGNFGKKEIGREDYEALNGGEISQY